MPKDETAQLAPHEADAVRSGYPFACTCGECFRSAGAAWGCRKCRTYLTADGFRSRAVWDLRTGLEAPRPA